MSDLSCQAERASHVALMCKEQALCRFADFPTSMIDNVEDRRAPWRVSGALLLGDARSALA